MVVENSREIQVRTHMEEKERRKSVYVCIIYPYTLTHIYTNTHTYTLTDTFIYTN